jgi:hypothetical protein
LRRAYLLLAMLFTALLCLSGIGVAAAEPQKNQIEVQTTPCSNGQDYKFVINGMSKTGDIEESTGNVVVKQYTVEYFEHPSGEFIEGDVYGNKKYYDEDGNPVLNGDLIHCSGETEDPIDVQGLGTVTANYDFQAFVTPRRGA